MRNLFFTIAIALLVVGCAQVNEQKFNSSCAVGRPPVEGELVPGQSKAGDYKTERWPWVTSHRIVTQCDAGGKIHETVESAIDNGFSELENPVGTAISHFNYGF